MPAINPKMRVVLITLLAALLMAGSILTPKLLAQRATASPPSQTYEFAFTRFLAKHGKAVAVDKAGYVYLAAHGPGVRGRSDQIRDALAGTLQVYLGTDDDDVFVAKFGPDGENPSYVKTLGGGGLDSVEDIAVDDSGNVYVTGSTASRNFPTTSQAVQRRIGGGLDCFVVKLSADGSVLYSTFLGGNKHDECKAIALDASGNAYVTGGTASSTFAGSKKTPSTVRRGKDDAFVAKLDPEGHTLKYMLVLGGTGGIKGSSFPDEFGADIVVDSAETAYVAGRTASADFPMPGGMPMALQQWGGFVVRVSSSGIGLLNGAYHGEGSDASAVALDAAGAVYVAGSVLDRTSKDVNRRQVVWKLTPTLDRAEYRSMGVPHAAWPAIAVDAAGRAYVSGMAERGVPMLNPLPGARSGGRWQQTFLLILSPVGEPLLSTPVAAGYGADVAVDISGAVYVAGSSGSPFGRTLDGDQSGGYVSKIIRRSP